MHITHIPQLTETRRVTMTTQQTGARSLALSAGGVFPHTAHLKRDAVSPTGERSQPGGVSVPAAAAL